MKNSIKSYFKDYGKLMDENQKFYKNHWKGTIVFCAGVWAITSGGSLLVLKIKQKIDERKKEKAAFLR